ncbi:MAG: hypothetical protein NT062_26200 [Proteobacteria bacterium]|nr:hypothetical protein [Pseudomonadota bacterium]
MVRSHAALVLGLFLALAGARAHADDFDAARKAATARALTLYSYATQHVGTSDGHLAPIIKTADGGFLVIGTTTAIPEGKPYVVGKSAPTVMKLDKAGAITWQQDYKAKGFLDYEGGAVAATADGNYLVYILSYVHPARGSVARFLQIDPTGKVRWELRLRGDGGPRTPFPDDVVLAKDGSLALSGHIYVDQTEQAYAWTGTIDKAGKLVADKVGGPFKP